MSQAQRKHTTRKRGRSPQQDQTINRSEEANNTTRQRDFQSRWTPPTRATTTRVTTHATRPPTQQPDAGSAQHHAPAPRTREPGQQNAGEKRSSQRVDSAQHIPTPIPRKQLNKDTAEGSVTYSNGARTLAASHASTNISSPEPGSATKRRKAEPKEAEGGGLGREAVCHHVDDALTTEIAVGTEGRGVGKSNALHTHELAHPSLPNTDAKRNTSQNGDGESDDVAGSAQIPPDALQQNSRDTNRRRSDESNDTESKDEDDASETSTQAQQQDTNESEIPTRIPPICYPSRPNDPLGEPSSNIWNKPLPDPNEHEVYNDEDDSSMDSDTEREYEEKATELEPDDEVLPNISAIYNTPPMKGILRTMTFNCNKMLRGKITAAATYAREAQADIFTINEPFAQSAQITDQEYSRMVKQANMQGYHLYYSKFNVILIKHSIASRQTQQPIIAHDGRIIINEFHVSEDKALLNISVYGVAEDGQSSIANTSKRNELRREILLTLSTHKRAFLKRTSTSKKTPLIHIMGDLQDTFTKTARDNVDPKNAKAPNKLGIIHWTTLPEQKPQDFSSVALTNTKEDEQYITRRGRGDNSGGRGIDHCVANRTLADLLERSDIDEHTAHIRICASDHYLVFADYDVGYVWSYHRPAKCTLTNYKMVANIPMKLIVEEGTITNIVYDTKLTEEELKDDDNHNTLQKYHQILLNEEDAEMNRLAKKSDKLLEDIQTHYLEQVAIQTAQGTDRLPERTPQLRIWMDELFETLAEADGRAMEKMNAVRSFTPAAPDCPQPRPQHIKQKDELHIKMKKARHLLNIIDNLISKATLDMHILHQERNQGRHNETRTNNIINLVDHIQRVAPPNIEAAHQVLIQIEQAVEDKLSSEKQKEAELGRGADPLQGSAMNRHKHLFSHATQSDLDSFAEMDDYLRSINYTHTNISSEVETHTKISSDNRDNSSHTTTTTILSHSSYWSDLTPLSIDPKLEDFENTQKASLKQTYDSLKEAGKAILRMKNLFNSRSQKHWSFLIREDALNNKYTRITQKAFRPAREGPKPHHSILRNPDKPRDEEGQLDWKHAKSTTEKLQGTKELHHNWTNPTGEKKLVHYCMPVKDAKGKTVRYEMTHAKPEPTDDEIKELVRDGGGCLLPAERLRYKEAHNSRTAHIFQNIPINHIFAYPYTVTADSTTIEFPEIRERFFKSIVSIPGKARHKGFTLAVVGRMPMIWINRWQQAIDLILALRIGPTMAKELSRIPIPKPGKLNETRPISAVHDVWAFALAASYIDLAAQVEKSGILSENIEAYRTRKTASDSPSEMSKVCEENWETGEPICIIFEDEEKYFDRVPAEMQEATMAANGMPDQGWMEIKSEDLMDRKCIIVTSLGPAECIFTIGMPQGQVLSVLTCNLTSSAKVQQYLLEDDKLPIAYNKGFTLAVRDPLDVLHDRKLDLYEKNYSDDTSLLLHEANNLNVEQRIRRNYSSSNKEEMCERIDKLISSAKAAVTRTGQYSAMAKIPRHGKKSLAWFINIPPDMAEIIPAHFETIEYSYEKGKPVINKVPTKTSIRRHVQLEDEPDELDAEEDQTTTEKEKAIRQLGVHLDNTGDTMATGQMLISKSKIKLGETRCFPRGCGPTTAAKLTNTYLIPTINWCPVEAKMDMAQLNKLDASIIKLNRKEFGLTWSDCAINLMRYSRNCGGGLASYSGSHLRAVARELETNLHNPGHLGTSYRASLALEEHLDARYKSDKIRAVPHAVDTLARFGIFLRDMYQPILSIFIEVLRMKMGIDSEGELYQPMGSLHFQGAGYITPHLGTGDRNLLHFSMNGKYYKALRNKLKDTIDNHRSLEGLVLAENWSDCPAYLKNKCPTTGLATIFCNTLLIIQDAVNIPLSWNEWRRTRSDTDPLTSKNWRSINSNFRINLSRNAPSVTQQIHAHQKWWARLHRLNADNIADGDILRQIKDSALPPIISVDGTESVKNERKRCAAGAVLSLCTNDPAESDWSDAKFIPVLARTSILPDMVGVEPTDNNTGEVVATILGEEILPPSLSAIYVADSTTSIGIFRTLRDGLITSDRAFIRCLMSGCGKAFVGRLLRNLAHHSTETKTFLCHSAALCHPLPPSDTPFQYKGKQSKPKFKYLQEDTDDQEDHLFEHTQDEEEGFIDNMPQDVPSLWRYWHLNQDTKSFEECVHDDTLPCPTLPINHTQQRRKMQRAQRDMKSWISYEPGRPYPPHCHDAHPHRPILKVDSHQLDKKTGKPTGRHKELTPNRIFVELNDIVDRTIDIDHPIHYRGKPHDQPCPPNQHFDFNATRFCLTTHGKIINKGTPKHIGQLEDQFRRFKMATRDEHGLHARHEQFIDFEAINLGYTGGGSKWLKSLASCHTRAMKYSRTYRLRHALHIDGRRPPISQSKEEAEQYLCEERETNIYEQCTHCAAEDILDHQENIEQFEHYLATNDDEIARANQHYFPKEYERYHQNRANAWHPHVCSKPEIKQARLLGNNHIQRVIGELHKLAHDALERMCIVAGTEVPSLHYHIMQRLSEGELVPHYVSNGTSGDYKRCRSIQRPTNTTIRTRERWLSETGRQHNAPLIRDALRRWPEAIEYGLFPPESQTITSPHNMCSLDTCIMGWSTTFLRDAILSYTDQIKDHPKAEEKIIKRLKTDLAKQYAKLRLAIFVKAMLMSKVTRHEQKLYEDKLRDMYGQNSLDNTAGKSDKEEELLNWDFVIDGVDMEQVDQNPMESDEYDPQAATMRSSAKKTKAQTTMTRCTGPRCKIADLADTKTGQVKAAQPHSRCNMCRTFNTDQTALKILHKEMAKETYREELTQLLRVKDGAKAPQMLKQLIIDRVLPSTSIAPKSFKPKLITRIGNTFLIKEKCGSQHYDIDQPLSEGRRIQLETSSRSSCKCDTKPTHAELLEAEDETPHFCQLCNLLCAKAPANEDTIVCITCAKPWENPEHEELEKVCTDCQLEWLLKHNNPESRYEQAREELLDMSKNPNQSRAERLMKNKRRITSPTLVPKGAARDSGRPNQILDRAISKRGIKLDPTDKTEIRLASLWNLESPTKRIDEHQPAPTTAQQPSTTQREHDTEDFTYLTWPNEWLDDNALEITIRKLRAKYNIRICHQFFFQWILGNSWLESRKYFTPNAPIEGWKTVATAVPIASRTPLIFPINCKLGRSASNNHWIMAVRFEQADETEDNNWDFAIVDSLNTSTLQRRYEDVIRYRTALHLQPDQLLLSDPNVQEARSSATFNQPETVAQTEHECGFRMVLHILIAGHSTSSADLQQKLNKLRRIEELNNKCRQWVYNIVTTEQERINTPDWIEDIITA